MLKDETVKVIDGDGRFYTAFVAVFIGEKVTTEQLVAAQIQAGYHPAGYGGPTNPYFRTVWNDARRNHKTIALWTCAGSCD